MASREPPQEASVVILACAADPSLQRAWAEARVPDGFRLRTALPLAAEPFRADGPTLILVGAEEALAAEGALADVLAAAVARCVWVGSADAIERLGAERLAEAYDILVTPVTPGLVSRRLADWSRQIRRTAALADFGRRAEDLAARNDRLAARIAEVETQAEALGHERVRLDRVIARIRQVARLSREINSLDLDRIVRVCIEELPALVEAQRASLYFYDAANDRLTLQGRTPGRPIADRVDLAQNPRSPMALAVRRGELLLIGEFRAFEQAREVVLEREFPETYATASCIIVPLKGGGRVRGVLNLADKKGGERFDEEIDLPVVEQIAELIGASIYNVELYQQMERRAKTDPLTGLANRRGAEEALARESDRSRRYGVPLSLLVLDVDGLKRINDHDGHEAGDAVLTHMAALLAETVRSVDSPARWGGDEFLVVLPDTNGAQAKRLARRLLKRVHERPARLGEKELPATISIGVAEYDREEPLEHLVRRVDQAMYDAKRAGRDRVSDADASGQ